MSQQRLDPFCHVTLQRQQMKHVLCFHKCQTCPSGDSPARWFTSELCHTLVRITPRVK